MAELNIQDYLGKMEDRLNARFDTVDENLAAIPILQTRIALVEQTQATLVKGIWGLFTAFVGAVATYFFNFFKHP